MREVIDSPSAAIRARASLTAQAILLGGLLAFVVIVLLIDRLRSVPTPVSAFTAVPLALIPALLWMVYFYLRDIHEPEPTHYVIGVFLLGALVAAPLAGWITDALFKVPSWGALPRWGLTEAVAAFLVLAPAQEMSKYLVVRYTVYLSAEFDEPMDGIVYMSAAGLGFATAWNIVQMTRAPQLALTTAAINAVTTTLAHASLSGVVGFAMGRAKFIGREGHQTRVLALGLGAAVVLSGLFTMLENVATRHGLDYRPAWGLASAAIFAILVFVLLSVLVDRHLSSSPHARRASTAFPVTEVKS
ncbi:MAG TPA: PrsW family glutamic-type intramembrane protease [Polyangia bacterium]